MERLLIWSGRAVSFIGLYLALPGLFIVDRGDRIENRGRMRRARRRQKENRLANPDFVKATRIE